MKLYKIGAKGLGPKDAVAGRKALGWICEMSEFLQTMSDILTFLTNLICFWCQGYEAFLICDSLAGLWKVIFILV